MIKKFLIVVLKCFVHCLTRFCDNIMLKRKYLSISEKMKLLKKMWIIKYKKEIGAKSGNPPQHSVDYNNKSGICLKNKNILRADRKHVKMQI